jgi:hypothetical protein
LGQPVRYEALMKMPLHAGRYALRVGAKTGDGLSLPRFRGHLWKGGYDGQDGRATGTATVHG